MSLAGAVSCAGTPAGKGTEERKMQPLNTLSLCFLPTQPGLQSLQNSTKNLDATQVTSLSYPLRRWTAEG